MKDVKKIQKHLAVFSLVLIIAWVILYVFWIRNLQVRNKTLSQQNADLTAVLSQKTNRPLVATELMVYKQNLEVNKSESAKQVLSVFEKAEEQFKPIFDPYGNGETFEDFKTRINYLVYKTEYISVKTEMSNRGVFLYDKLLNLYEESLPDLPYRHYIQLKLVHQLLTLSRSYNLSVSHDSFKYPGNEPAAVKARKPARVTVLPVKHYVIEGSDKPFMEEYPVRITVRGRVNQISNFLLSLTGNKRFMPLQSIEMRRVVTGKQEDEWDGIVEAEIVCSAMLILVEKSILKESSRKLNQKVSLWKRGF